MTDLLDENTHLVNELERVRAERDRLREALADCENELATVYLSRRTRDSDTVRVKRIIDNAREALEDKP